LVDCDHIGWNSSEIISPLVSLGCSHCAICTTTAVSRRGRQPSACYMGFPLTPRSMTLDDLELL